MSADRRAENADLIRTVKQIIYDPRRPRGADMDAWVRECEAWIRHVRQHMDESHELPALPPIPPRVFGPRRPPRRCPWWRRVARRVREALS